MTIKFNVIPVIPPNGTDITRCFSSGFGIRSRPKKNGKEVGSKDHKGVDISFAGINGQTIYSVAPGKVVAVNPDSVCGNGVIVQHLQENGRDTFRTLYCHMLQQPLVSVGQSVSAGTPLGKVGSTGASTGPHLHFGLNIPPYGRASYIDPKPYLANVGTPVPVIAGSPVSSTSVTPPRTAGSGIASKISGLESFHPNIQYELTRRKKGSETANTYFPYVKLTSLVNVLGKNVQGGKGEENAAFCPSLGIHGAEESSFEEIYSTVSKRSVVAKAISYDEENPQIVNVLVENADEDPPNIPPPGITSLTTERNTAGAMGVRGGLFRATVKISAYSIGQLNTLLKYFLRPGTRVAIEFGKETSSQYGMTVQPFNWQRPRKKIDEEIAGMVYGTNPEAGQKFIQKYIYNNFGNYEIYIGYVVTFKFRYTKNNVYEIELQIQSVQQVEVPVKYSSARSICKPGTAAIQSNCGVLDINDYFSVTSGFKGNSFFTLLNKTTTPGEALNAEYGQHVIPLLDSNEMSKTHKNGYLVSWTFFINKVLNDDVHGLMSVLQLNDSPSTKLLLKNSFPKEITGSLEGMNDSNINEYEVAWHPSLRSTDASVMVIDNRTAQSDANLKNVNQMLGSIGALDAATQTQLTNTKIYDLIVASGNGNVGHFYEKDKGLSTLTSGVWLNSNAIISAFSNADTVSVGLDNLLTKMNNATEGYWNLQVLSNDQANPGVHVIDMGFSKPNTKTIKPMEEEKAITGQIDTFESDLNALKIPNTDIPRYLYMFNRKIKQLQDNDTLSGELLDINYEASLPLVIAIQAIAGIGGVSQRGTLAAIDVDELKRITMYDVYPGCSSANDICGGDPAFYNSTPAAGFKILTQEDIEKFTKAYQEAQTDAARSAVDQEINSKRDEILSKSSTGGLGSFGSLSTANDLEKDIGQLKETFKSITEQQNGSYINLVKEYSGMYGKAIEMIAYDKTKLLQALDLNRKDNEIHPFNSSNLTKTTVDLTLPGIGGISLFEAFAVDRIPNILSRGYYIVTKIAQDFSVSQGWTTKITGRFRFRPST